MNAMGTLPTLIAGSLSLMACDKSPGNPHAAPIEEESVSTKAAAIAPPVADTALPMPGQNNDHSVPLGPAQRASAP